MVQANPWEDYEWPASEGDKIHHLTAEDIRRFIWLTTIGHYAHASSTVFEAQDTSKSPGESGYVKRFAGSFADLLADYPTEDIVYDTGDGPPSEYVQNVQHPRIEPGAHIVFHEREFEHQCLGVVITTEEPLGEFKFAATEKNVYGIYDENGSTIDIDGTLETWYEEQDDFRRGTPFILKSAGEDISTNDGFYRVRSVRYESGYVYVTPDNNNYEQQELVECTYSDEDTTAKCDFGGDWYIFRGGNGNSLEGYMTDGGHMDTMFSAKVVDEQYVTSRDRWWSNKDFIHRYVGNVSGPNDGRPPDGGQMSADCNGDWIRCPNPNLYHTYDTNAHRWDIKAHTINSPGDIDYEQYTALIPAHEYLPTQTDPKEVESPFFYEDTYRIHWKYGDKVSIRATQITDSANLGAIQAVRANGYWTSESGNLGDSTDHQYNTTFLRTTSTRSYPQDGYFPNTSLNTYPDSWWYNRKYDTALQNMVELACSSLDWVLEVDSAYVTNWLWINQDNTIASDLQEWLEYDNDLTPGELDDATYQDIVDSYGESAAYDPVHCSSQLKYDYLNTEYWGCNSSAFELILKKLGSDYYDWYYDTDYPYRSKRILDDYWKWDADNGEDEWIGTWNGVECETGHDVADACWPEPKGVWRRTWKYSLGRVDDIFMRSGEGGPPVGDQVYEYDDVSETGHNRMVGTVVMETPTIDNTPEDTVFYSWDETDWTEIEDNVISFVGDKTDEFHTGWKVWAKENSEDEYYSFTVLNVTFDGTNTVIRLSDNFDSVNPTTLYGDIDLSETHDGCLAINDTIHYQGDRLPLILNHCRVVLQQLQYKAVPDVSAGFYSFSWSANGFHTPTSLAGVFAQVEAGWELEKYENDYDDLDSWSAEGSGYVWFGTDALYDIWQEATMDSGEVAIKEMYLQITNPIFSDPDGTQLNMLIGAYYYAHYEIPLTSPVEYFLPDERQPSVGIEGVFDMQVGYADVGETYYVNYCWMALPLSDDTYTRYWMNVWGGTGSRDYTDCEFVFSGGEGMAQHRIDCSAYVKIVSSTFPYMMKFDWYSYTDLLWDRTKERADYKLIDPYGPDTKPPVWRNEWNIVPTLYDNLYSGMKYDAEGYIGKDGGGTCWKIKARPVLMEDLEGNGVSYIIDFYHETYGTDADLMDQTSTVRKYDKTLDMGENQSIAGDEFDAWYTRDHLIDEWEVTLNSKDNYSDRIPPGLDDNIGTPADPVLIDFDSDVPMFPVSVMPETSVTADLFGLGSTIYYPPCRIGIIGPTETSEPTEWWDFIKVKLPIMPDDAELTFVLERATNIVGPWTECAIDTQPLLWDYEEETQDVTVSERAPNMVGDGCIWIEAPDCNRYVYRLRYKNVDTGKSGIKCQYELPSGYVLKILDSSGYTVTVDSVEVDLPYTHIYPVDTEVEVESDPLNYYWIDSLNETTYGDNPLTLTMDKDYTIQPY
jgi:hypothetical protein